MINFFTKKRGYLNIEGAIFVPIYILAIISIIFIIKYAIVIEGVCQITFDETKVYINDVYTAALLGNEREKIKNRLQDDITQISNVDVGLLLPFLLSLEEDNVLCYNVSYNVNVPIPLMINDDFKTKHLLVFRPFIGKDNSSEELMDPAKNEIYEEVWVFPKAGEKFHYDGCTYIKSYAKEGTLNWTIKNVYNPCQLCNAASLRQGDVVYYFPRSGEKYHRATCNAVDKYVISMDLQEAEMKGYMPCKKCGSSGAT